MCKTNLGKERPSLRDLNSAIASNLSAVITPSRRTHNAQQSAPGSSVSLNSQIAHLCSHPGFKFMDVKAVPQVFLLFLHSALCSLLILLSY